MLRDAARAHLSMRRVLNPTFGAPSVSYTFLICCASGLSSNHFLTHDAPPHQCRPDVVLGARGAESEAPSRPARIYRARRATLAFSLPPASTSTRVFSRAGVAFGIDQDECRPPSPRTFGSHVEESPHFEEYTAAGQAGPGMCQQDLELLSVSGPRREAIRQARSPKRRTWHSIHSPGDF